ncbi:MAG TPA: histidine phosphatase family protein [Patescibacteria group bacterium]|nr:histidine phosphatase family protein [Patescibacteria group bacterium]
MTTLYLIRHGHFANVESLMRGISPQAPLDELGRSQIKLLAERLKDETIKLVLTSEFTRARESGQIIAEKLNIPLEKTPVLNELGFFVRPQEIVGFERDESKYEQALQDVAEASQKAVQFLQKVANEHQGETIAVVCHGNIIRGILMEALKADPDSMIRFQVDLASLTVLEYDGADLFRLIRLNDTSHLETK